MNKQTQTFTELMNSFSYRYDTRAVFEDFLKMAMCAVTQIPGAGKSYYEDLYLDTIKKYANDDLRHQFPKMFSQLVMEMEGKSDNRYGNDILGNYYEMNFCNKNSGQFFTPYTVCRFMAEITCMEAKENRREQRAIDPCCGSGRNLVASSRVLGPGHEHYGIDIDHTCVKMTALNLFLNSVFKSEVMWADALSPDDFRMSYKVSFLPLGIFRIEDKELSRLWHLNKNSFERIKSSSQKPDIQFSPTDNKAAAPMPQLKLF